MKKKLALITGGTDGIGKAIALGLAKIGYDLVIIARNEAKYELLKVELEKISQKIQVKFFKADLSLVQDTQKGLRKIKDNISSLDLIVQTAGLIPKSIVHTKEGMEETFAVSYLTRFLVTNELLPLLLESQDKLLFIVAGAGQKGRIYFEDINFERRKFSPIEVVKQFQQCNDAYALYLSQKHRNLGLSVYCYNPGLVDTGIHAGWPFPFSFLMQRIAKHLFMKQPEQAAVVPLSVIDGSRSFETILINSKGKDIYPAKPLQDPAYLEKVFMMSRSLISKSTALNNKSEVGE